MISGYFGQLLCLLAITATTRLLLLLLSDMRASGKTKKTLSMLFPLLNVSWYMTYLRPAVRAGSSRLVYDYGLDCGIEFPCSAAESQRRAWLGFF